MGDETAKSKEYFVHYKFFDAPKRRINSVKKIEKNRGSGECIQAMTGRSNWRASPDPAALILQATKSIACRSF
ncbi:MAG: hypothetical protein ACPGNR_04660 [Paracoccaceae bacterium]